MINEVYVFYFIYKKAELYARISFHQAYFQSIIRCGIELVTATISSHPFLGYLPFPCDV